MPSEATASLSSLPLNCLLLRLKLMQLRLSAEPSDWCWSRPITNQSSISPWPRLALLHYTRQASSSTPWAWLKSLGYRCYGVAHVGVVLDTAPDPEPGFAARICLLFRHFFGSPPPVHRVDLHHVPDSRVQHLHTVLSLI